MSKFIKKIMDNHVFFVSETPKFMGKLSIKDKFYYPIAYLKFMWYSL